MLSPRTCLWVSVLENGSEFSFSRFSLKISHTCDQWRGRITTDVLPRHYFAFGTENLMRQTLFLRFFCNFSRFSPSFAFLHIFFCIYLKNWENIFFHVIDINYFRRNFKLIPKLFFSCVGFVMILSIAAVDTFDKFWQKFWDTKSDNFWSDFWSSFEMKWWVMEQEIWLFQ